MPESGSISERLGLNELVSKRGSVGKALLAEATGTLLLVLFGCGACVKAGAWQDPPLGIAQLVLISLAFGLAVMAVVQAVGHVSGAHVNPAVTAGLLVAGRIPPVKAFLYVVAQCIGAIAGAALLKALTPAELHKQGLGATTLTPGVAPVQGFGIEFFLGFVLVLVVFGACDAHKPASAAAAPLTIGLTVALGHLAMIDFTGSSMNPARSLGSAVLTDIDNAWDHHWVYWLGPILGGVAAGLLYEHVLKAPAPEVEEYSPVRLTRLDKGKDEDGAP